MGINHRTFVALLLLASVNLSLGQYDVDRFVMNVFLHNATEDHWGTFKCKATVITSRYVLTTATCATVTPPMWLSLGLWIFRSRWLQGPVEEITFHPDYVAGNNTFANIAVMRWANRFNITETPPRILGKLSSNETCNLFGFGSEDEVPTHHSLDVFGPQLCDPNLPRVFCSVLPSTKHVSCGASEGSPVACTNRTIDGILLNQDNCTEAQNGFRLNYLSIHEFRDWIDEVSAAKPFSISAAVVILSAVIITLTSAL